MSVTDPQYALSVSRFLEASRSYLSLPERRRMARVPARRMHSTVLRLVLLAGAVGPLFGGAAMAEIGQRGVQAPNGGTQLATPDRPTRNALERTP